MVSDWTPPGTGSSPHSRQRSPLWVNTPSEEGSPLGRLRLFSGLPSPQFRRAQQLGSWSYSGFKTLRDSLSTPLPLCPACSSLRAVPPQGEGEIRMSDERGWLLSEPLKSAHKGRKVAWGQTRPSGQRLWPGFRLGVKEAAGGGPHTCRDPSGSVSLGMMEVFGNGDFHGEKLCPKCSL